MVDIRPFRAFRYDLSRAGQASDLLAPPYDVVDAEGRAELAARSPHNCIQVILPEADPSDTDPDAKYREGARLFQAYIQDAFTQDEKAGYYVYHQRFQSEGKSYVRKGFVSLIELSRFGEGKVLPHERTLSGPKEDRLKLMRACDAHLELVFGMFSDPDKSWEVAIEGQLGEAVLECEFDGTHHTLYRVDDAAACEKLSKVLEARSVYIADGHHRYETMCTFRDELEAAGRGEEGKWGMIYLSNLDDPGLVVLPTHRLVHSLAAVDLPAVLEAAKAHFTVEKIALPGEVSALRKLLQSAGEKGAAFGLTLPGSKEVFLLQLREDFDPVAAGLGDLPPALQRLDVALLHELILERALGITKEAQAAKTNLHYYKSSEKALQVAAQGDGEHQLVCFMNATPVQDVVDVCDSGQVMPQKSTFFYPKIPTGLAFRSLKSSL